MASRYDERQTTAIPRPRSAPLRPLDEEVGPPGALELLAPLGPHTWRARRDGQPVVARRVSAPGAASPPPEVHDGVPTAEHHGLVPVTGTTTRDGAVWLVSPHVPGVSLQRLLEIARPTPAQAALVATEVRDGVRTLASLGLRHDRLHCGNVLVDLDGLVRLADWAAAAPDTARRADGRPEPAEVAVRLLAAIGRPARLDETSARLLGALSAVAQHGDEGSWDTLADELERSRSAERARHGLAALARAADEVEQAAGGTGHVRRLLEVPPAGGDGPAVVGSVTELVDPEAAPRVSPLLEAATRERRRRVRRRATVAIVGASVVLIALAVEIVALQGRISQSLASLTAAGPAAGATGPTGPSLRPVPALAPRAAGPVLAVDVRPLATCTPGDACRVRFVVQAATRSAPRPVTWSVAVVDRCSGQVVARPGGKATVPARSSYAVSQATVRLPASGALSLVAVTGTPARAASPPYAVPAAGACPSR